MNSSELSFHTEQPHSADAGQDALVGCMRWLDGHLSKAPFNERTVWGALRPLDNARKPAPTDFQEVRRVRWILAEKVLFNEAPDHEKGDEGYCNGQVKRRKGTKNEGE